MNTDLIMISAIQHYAYCPRQYALIHLEQEFADNEHTTKGTLLHEQVDIPEVETTLSGRIERALPLFSHKLGLTGRADVVEFKDDGTIFPIEYKKGKKKSKIFDDLQLMAQAYCLEEMFNTSISSGAIFYFSSKKRREVEFTSKLRQQCLNIICEIKNLQNNFKMPKPLTDARCKECSLNGLCQPTLIYNASELNSMQLFKNLFKTED